MRKQSGKLLYRLIKWLVRQFYSEIQVVNKEKLPDEPAIIVANHAQMHGPIACELYFPGKRYIWCAGQMMHLKEVPDYAFEDFWSKKPPYSRWFFRMLSYMIAPLSVCVFNHADTIGVYHDARILSTFKNTVSRLEEGANIVIFPEHLEINNHIICNFRDGFVDVAKLYYKRTGRELPFVPMYIAPKLKKMYLGQPVRFCAKNSMEKERERICRLLMERITEIAVSLPEHTVIPYQNILRREYCSNISMEETEHEKT